MQLVLVKHFAGLALSLSLSIHYTYHPVYTAGDATELFLFTDVALGAPLK